MIDPIGLALENFDAIGRWRDSDVEAHAPIDAKTVLPNGQASRRPGRTARGTVRRPRPVRAGAHREADDVRRSGGSSSTTTCRRCAPWCARRRHRITGCRRSSSGIVTSDAFRMQAGRASEEPHARMKHH